MQLLHQMKSHIFRLMEKVINSLEDLSINLSIFSYSLLLDQYTIFHTQNTHTMITVQEMQ